jgi:prevent-host-death family protein
MLIDKKELKNDVDKYLKLVNQEDIIISRNGKQIAKLTAISPSSTPNLDGLLELLKSRKKVEDVDIDQIREERLKK